MNGLFRVKYFKMNLNWRTPPCFSWIYVLWQSTQPEKVYPVLKRFLCHMFISELCVQFHIQHIKSGSHESKHIAVVHGSVVGVIHFYTAWFLVSVEANCL